MSISFLNSLTPRNVVSGFVFTGVYDEILSASQISVIITTTSVINSYTLFVEYSNDKVNVVSQESSIAIDNLNYIHYFTPTSRYFRLRLEASSNITDLSIETIFKTAIIYQPETAIYGTVSVNNFPAIDNVVSVDNFPATQAVNITESIPLTITNETFNSNITASVPLDVNVLTLPAINITNTAFDSKIISSITLDTNVLTLPSINITNTAFDSNITASIALDTNVLSLPSIAITNTAFDSNYSINRIRYKCFITTSNKYY